MDDVLLPLPRDFDTRAGRSSLTSGNCSIKACDSNKVRRFVSALELGGVDFSCSIANPVSDSPPLLVDDYSYTLEIGPPGIDLRAESEQGALTGCSTLAQLAASRSLPHCTIKDCPRHPWRGLLVDVSRHFMEPKTLRSVIELMHHFKLNVLHLHLTDDQAFRFASEAYPELASTQSYSKDQLRQLVEHAANHAVRIVPEIDIPGHATSWLVAHPEWGSEPVDPSTQTDFGALKACLDPSKDVVIDAVKTILAEVIDVFPDEYVHIGGDEVDPLWWNRSEAVQAWAASRGLRSVRDIQADFTLTMVKFIESCNRKVVVWDEALHETLPRSVVVQAWRGMPARDLAVVGGYQTIVSSPYYLDLNYHAETHYGFWPSMSPSEWKSQAERMENDDVLEHVRDGVKWHQSFGEFPHIPERSGGCILGGEACMWSELVTDELLLRRVWTRMPSIAERFWIDSSAKGESTVSERLDASLSRLRTLGYPDIVSSPPIHECQELQPLFEMLEPVKWYARMLTTSGTEARAQGEQIESNERPYNAQTMLDRIVDKLPSDSPEVRRCRSDILAGRDLSVWSKRWRSQYHEMDQACGRFPELNELREASEALYRLADVADGRALPSKDLGGPFGEYLLPIAFAFAHSGDDS